MGDIINTRRQNAIFDLTKLKRLVSNLAFVVKCEIKLSGKACLVFWHPPLDNKALTPNRCKNISLPIIK